MNSEAEPPSQPTKSSPLFAFSLSGLMLGLGQLYVGRPKRAVFLFAGFAAFQILLCLAIFLAPPSGKLDLFKSGSALLFALWLLAMLDASNQARKFRVLEMSRFRRFPVYLGYFALGWLLMLSFVCAERMVLIDVYRVKSTSMSPSLRNGDYVLVNRQIDCIDCATPLCIGDIVVFENRGSILIKRIVGRPGDTIGIDDRVLSVNGQPVTESRASSIGDPEIDHFHRSSSALPERLGAHEYLSLWGEPHETSLETQVVPSDAVFVLGDNRHHSKDSRQLGAIPLKDVRGRVDQIWFSRDDQSGTRRERAGTPLASSSCRSAPDTPTASRKESHPAASRQPLPNLLIITIDTLRVDHVGTYGYAGAKTETIDRVAELGVRFENAATPFPRTTPALASLFTGLWPHHHGARDVGIPIKSGQMLAEVLKQQGYATHAVTSTALASSQQHFDRGFDHFDGRTHHMDQLLATDVTNRALEMVQLDSRTSPQFLWVHYFDPHFPYAPPRGFSNQPEAPACRQLIRNVLDHPGVEWNLHSNWGRVAERTRSDCLELYDAEIHYTDTEIARLLGGLNDLGFLESVVIVITSDHGESFGESGTYYEHGATVHDAVVRIPLIIVAPGVETRSEPKLFSLEDLMPTLLGLLEVGAEERPLMDGHDYSQDLLHTPDRPGRAQGLLFAEGANTNKPPLFALPFDAAALQHSCTPGKALEACRQFGGAGELLAAIMAVDTQDRELPEIQSVTDAAEAINARFRFGDARQRSVRTQDFKLVQAPRVDGGVQRKLFHLVGDSRETTDVSAQYPKVRKRLGAELDAWLETLPKFKNQSLAPEHTEVLRKLGYAE